MYHPKLTLSEYQEIAEKSNREPTKARPRFALLGLFGEAGSVLSEVKKKQRDEIAFGSRWFKSFSQQIQTFSLNGKPYVRWQHAGLFEEIPTLNEELRRFIDATIDRIGVLTDSELKSRAYLTDPMKRSLLAERAGVRQLNRPLL